MAKIEIELTLHPWFSDTDNFSWLVHNGGEVHVTLKDNFRLLPFYSHLGDSVTIHAYLYNSDMVLLLANLVDAIRAEKRYQGGRINAILYYVPYARADRRIPGGGGDSLGIRVIADIINGLKLDSVTLVDPHSPVAPAVFNNALVRSKLDIMASFADDSLTKNRVIVSPDEGAAKEGFQIARELGAKQVRFIKNRNPQTGQINTVLPLNVIDPNDEHLIVDDIIDGGRTFMEVARNLGNDRSKRHLYATHGIFSDGFSKLLGYFETITVLHSFRKIEKELRDRIIVLDDTINAYH